MQAEIITIGDEIVIGQIVDTNSAWISRRLNLAGVETSRIVSVRDRHEEILAALEEAGRRCDLVLITGGLGPTRDDITKATLCEFFRTTLVFDQSTFDRISQRFEKRGIPLNKLNRDQALVPAACTVIPNLNGTAPGMWFEKDNVIFVSMPGVPFEMEAMMTGEILPRIIDTGRTAAICHKTILTQGVPESVLADRLEAWETGLPPHIRLAYLPSPMAVRLRLSATGTDRKILEQETAGAISQLLPLIQDCHYGFDDDTMAMAVGKLLTGKNATLAVAESCTGGNISHLITLTPGSSAWYTGGITAYSNEVKTNLLGVSPETLSQYGAVSHETAAEMAQGVRKRLKTTYGVATTGIAGPDGASPGKPVGTVWISVASPTKFFCEKFVFGNDRERNILRASQTALQLLRKFILQD